MGAMRSVAGICLTVCLASGCAPEDLRYLDQQDKKAVWLDAPHEVQLPPLPDPVQNAATVSGVDANGNGVRDDVELWIVQTYGRDPQQAQALQQVARAVQKTMIVGLAAADGVARGQAPASWLPAAGNAMRGNVMSGACVIAVFGGYDDRSSERGRAKLAGVAVDSVVRRVLDSDDRVLAYQVVERLVKGQAEVVKPLEAALNPCQ